MKKLLSMILILTFVLSTVTVAFAETGINIVNEVQAIKGISTVYINNTPVQFEIYKLGGSEYYKLRDLAKALNGTENQFDVGYIQAKDTVTITTNKPYKEVGGELKPTNSAEIVNIDNSKWDNLYRNLYVDGMSKSSINFINGSAYIDIPNLSELIGFRTNEWHDKEEYKFIRTRQKPIVNYNTTMTQPYTFSQTKLDYPYNIYIEGKGYMNFGTAKPFMENGALYLPIKHLAYLGNYYDYTFEPETNSVILSNDFTEKDLYEGKTVREVMEPLVKYNDKYSFKELWSADGGSVHYTDREEFILNINSSIVTTKDYWSLTDWGLEFFNNRGIYCYQVTGGTFYFRLDEGGWEYGGGVNEWIKRHNNSSDSFDSEYKVILKNGEPYWERSVLNATVGTTMLMDEVEKTLYYGTDEYIANKLQEMEKTLKMDDSFNNGKTYMETMDDIFKDVPVYVPPKR